MVRLICMANSWRDGGRCIAGIDIDTGQWVRPVPPGGGPIPEPRAILEGKQIAPLDLIQMDLDEPAFNTRFQCENRRVLDWNWKRLNRILASNVVYYSSRSKYVLHGPGKVVEPAQMESLPPQKWASLQLIHVKNAFFRRDDRKADRWKAEFSIGWFGPKYCIAVTDPQATELLNKGEEIRAECLLTVSLTEPIEFPQYNKPPLCYKLVAGVIEL
jgi:hypothetical protein